MNLVELYRKMSAIRELMDSFTFRVEPFPAVKGRYFIVFKRNRTNCYVSLDFVNFIMNKAMQYKKNAQGRLVFKTSFELYQAPFDIQQIVLFNSKEKAELALKNMLSYINKHHGSLAHSVIKQATSCEFPF